MFKNENEKNDEQRTLVDILQLDVKDQSRIGRNDWRRTLLSVAHICGNDNASLAADSHANHSDIPALDDLTASQGEFEGRTALCTVKHLVVRLESTFIVHGRLFAGFRFGSRADN